MNVFVLEAKGMKFATGGRIPRDFFCLRAQASTAGVFLNHDYFVELAQNLGDSFGVERFECVGGEHSDLSSFLCFDPGRHIESHLHDRSVRNQADTGSLLYFPKFAELEGLRSVRSQVRFARFAKAKVSWPL